MTFGIKQESKSKVKTCLLNLCWKIHQSVSVRLYNAEKDCKDNDHYLPCFIQYFLRQWARKVPLWTAVLLFFTKWEEISEQPSCWSPLFDSQKPPTVMLSDKRKHTTLQNKKRKVWEIVQEDVLLYKFILNSLWHIKTFRKCVQTELIYVLERSFVEMWSISCYRKCQSKYEYVTTILWVLFHKAIRKALTNCSIILPSESK